MAKIDKGLDMDTNKLNIKCMFKCDVVMVFKCITQRLSDIWFSIRKKVKQHWGWVEKKRFWKKRGMVEKEMQLYFLSAISIYLS